MILKDEQFITRAKQLVTEAKSSILIATFKAEITTKRRGAQLKGFFDMLIQAALEGVDVRIITNGQENRGHIPDSNTFALRTLKFTKVKVRLLPNSRVCHAKILIVDGQAAILGSHNLSVRSCHNNFEISCLIGDIPAVSELTIMFEEAWSTGKAI